MLAVSGKFFCLSNRLLWSSWVFVWRSGAAGNNVLDRALLRVLRARYSEYIVAWLGWPYEVNEHVLIIIPKMVKSTTVFSYARNERCWKTLVGSWDQNLLRLRLVDTHVVYKSIRRPWGTRHSHSDPCWTSAGCHHHRRCSSGSGWGLLVCFPWRGLWRWGFWWFKR